jgi:glucuronoarabinoxylan endo-1,4-beta-xylanase
MKGYQKSKNPEEGFIRLLFPGILLAFSQILMLISCTKEKSSAGTGTGGKSYASFITNTVTAKADQDSISVGIRWSATNWTVTTQADGFITGFSRNSGGASSDQSIAGSLYVRLKPHLGEDPRQQDIVIKDIATGKEEKMVLTQTPLSGSDKITINPSVKYQKVTGFGGMINPTWTGSTQLSVQDIDKLYGPDGIGLNIGRLMLYPNTANWSREVAVAKRAKQYGAILFASPWTPPTHLKSSNTNGNQNGEYLLPGNYAAFATHIKSYVDFYKAEGIAIEAVSVQNEPDYKVGYDGCSYSPEQMRDFVQGHGRSVGTKLMASETVQFRKDYTDILLNDPQAVNSFDIVATHLYGFNFRTMVSNYPLAKQHNKEVWVTEHLFNEEFDKLAANSESRNWPFTWKYDWEWLPSLKTTLAEELHDCMNNNFNAYVYWYLKRYYGFMGEDKDAANPAGWYIYPNGEITKRGYIISHYAKYATGRTRIEASLGSNIASAQYTTGQPSFLVTAYEGNNDITLVLINRATSAKILDIVVPAAINSVTAIETTSSKNMISLDNSLSRDKKSVRVRISPESITSFKLSL